MADVALRHSQVWSKHPQATIPYGVPAKPGSAARRGKIWSWQTSPCPAILHPGHGAQHIDWGAQGLTALMKCCTRQPAALSLTHLNKCQGTLSNSCKPSTQEDPAEMATECGFTLEELKTQNKIDKGWNWILKNSLIYMHLLKTWAFYSSVAQLHFYITGNWVQKSRTPFLLPRPVRCVFLSADIFL